MSFNTMDTGNHTKEIVITFIVPEKDYIYKDFITCSVYSPHVTLTPWKADKQSVSHYDPSFKDSKQVFNETFSISMTATTTQQYNYDPIYLYCSYYRHSEKKLNHALFTFNFEQPSHNEQTNDTTDDVIQPIVKQTSYASISVIDDYFSMTIHALKYGVSSLKTDNRYYCFSFLFLLFFLIVLFHFFKEKLQKHENFYEPIEVFLSLLIVSSIAYVLFYFYDEKNAFITMIITCICATIAGLFYIKKSTKFRSGSLRTLCTCMGMLWICSTMFFAFKALQHADMLFHLL